MTASPSPTLLAVDAGNSRIKFGLFEPADEASRLAASLAIGPEADVPWETIRGWSAGRFAAGVVTGSSPAGRDRVIASWPEDLPSPEVVVDPDRLGLVARVAEPGRVGIDRLLNAVAVNRLKRVGRAAVIVDSGTATTVDAVDGDGGFLGGAILPGFGLSARALHRYTALLPLLTLDQLGPDPPDVLGTDTPSAIASGLVYGQLGAVRELVTRLCDRLGAPDAELYLTGGGGPLLAGLLDDANLVPHLGLHGLAAVAVELGLVDTAVATRGEST